MLLDTPTVSFIAVLVVCLESGILTALWIIHRDMRGVAYWAAGAACITIGMFFVLMGGMLPLPLYIVAANMSIFTGMILTWFGIEVFFDRPLPYRAGAAIVAVLAFGLIYFTVIDLTTRPRLTFLIAVYAVLSALRAHAILRDLRPQTRFSQILAAVPLALQSLFSLGLAMAAWHTSPPELPSTLPPMAGWILLVPMLLSLMVVFTAVLLVNQTIAARLKDMARSDPLTSALTRRAMEETAESEIARSRRHHLPLSLLLLDLDHFKRINDQHGHPAGDAMLRQFAEVVRQCLRREDVFGRLGGEEFCTLLPNTPLDGACQLAERIRHAVATHGMEAGGRPLSLTVSIGVAGLGEHGNAWHELVQHADAALYRAKDAGRNLVVTAAS